VSVRYLKITELWTQYITRRACQYDELPVHQIKPLTRKIGAASVQFIDCGRGTGS